MEIGAISVNSVCVCRSIRIVALVYITALEPAQILCLNIPARIAIQSMEGSVMRLTTALLSLSAVSSNLDFTLLD